MNAPKPVRFHLLRTGDAMPRFQERTACASVKQSVQHDSSAGAFASGCTDVLRSVLVCH